MASDAGVPGQGIGTTGPDGGDIHGGDKGTEKGDTNLGGK